MTAIITKPFSWLLLQLSYLFGNYGLALIVFGMIIVLIKLPFDIRSKRSMMKTGLLQPQMNKLKERHGENTPKYNEEIQKLYKEEGVNPMSGCLWSLIPLVIVIILISVVRYPLKHLMGLTEDQISLVASTIQDMGLSLDTSSGWSQIYMANYIAQYYDEIKAVVPEVIKLNMNFLGIGVGSVPSFKIWQIANWSREQILIFFLPVLSAGLSVISQKLATSMSFQEQDERTASMTKSMTLLSPIMSLWIGYSYPVALSLYWLSQNFLTMVSSFFINRHFKKEYKEMTKAQEEKFRQKEAELEAKRRETERLRALNATKENRNTSKKNKKKLEKLKQEERLAADKKDLKKEFNPDEEPSRIGNRKYARGRAYDPDRYGDSGSENDDDSVTETDSDDYSNYDTENIDENMDTDEDIDNQVEEQM